MVRTKYTPPRHKYELPEVTEMMIANYRKRGRPLKDPERNYFAIREAILQELLVKQREDIERQRELIREARERQERLNREERERVAREREEQERLTREEAEKEHVERQRLALDQALERAKQERSLRDQIEQRRAEVARLKRQRAETKRLEQERIQQRRLNDEREAQAREARIRAEMERIEREQQAQREAGIRRYGEVEYYKHIRAKIEQQKQAKIAEELSLEKARTKKLLKRPDPMFEHKLATLKRQLSSPDDIAKFKKHCECPRMRETNRGSALEMQRIIELYDMIEDDWELDDIIAGRTIENRVTTTTPPCDPDEPLSLAAMLPSSNKPKDRHHSHASKANDMIDPDYNALLARFGSKPYYRLVFTGKDTHDPIATYRELDRAKKRNETEYEVARQKFLQILGFHPRRWCKTNPNRDIGVEISRLHHDDMQEYIGFMRIRSGGCRGETYAPGRMQIIFHLLLGKVSFDLNKRTRVLTRGSHMIVSPEQTYAITCLERDQAAFFVFQITFTSRSTSSAQIREYFGLKVDP